MLVYSFKGLVRYRYGEKHGRMQADMALEKDLSILYFDTQAAEGNCVTLVMV